MRSYLRSLKHSMGFAAVTAALVVGMAVFAAGSATAAPVGDNATLGAVTVMQPVMLPGAVMAKASSDAAFNKPFFNRPFIKERPFFNRPFFNPFFDDDVDVFVRDFD